MFVQYYRHISKMYQSSHVSNPNHKQKEPSYHPELKNAIMQSKAVIVNTCFINPQVR